MSSSNTLLGRPPSHCNLFVTSASVMRPVASASRRIAEWSELSSRGTDTTIVVLPISSTFGRQPTTQNASVCMDECWWLQCKAPTNRYFKRWLGKENGLQHARRGCRNDNGRIRTKSTPRACIFQVSIKPRLLYRPASHLSASPQTRCQGPAALMLPFARHLRKSLDDFFCFLLSGGAATAPARERARGSGYARRRSELAKAWTRTKRREGRLVVMKRLP